MLDASTAALEAATTTITIGVAPLYWDAIPSAPQSYDVKVGDKLSFHFSNLHNVWALASQEALEA